LSKRDYSEEDVERGLQALALWQGNRNRAAKSLRDIGHSIPAGTLRSWKDRYPDRYADARTAIQERVWAETAEEWKAVVRESIEATSEAVTKAKTLIAAGEIQKGNQAAGAARNLATVAGIGSDKGLVIDGKPTTRTATDDRSLPELLKALMAESGGAVKVDPVLIESTAEEVDPQG
jgi:hypothetical protein